MPAKKLKVKIQNSKVQVKSQKLEKKTIKTAKKVDGIAVDVYNVKGKVIGKTSLPKELFGAKVNSVLLAQAVRVYLANQHRGTASTKTRGEVTASTRKIYRQKGTGRARHGGISAPIFVGGGVVFGPKPRDFSLTLPKKMSRKALMGALTAKLRGNAVKVVDGLEKLAPKTKVMHETLNALAHSTEASTELSRMSSGQANNKILLVTPGRIETVQRAARNIDGVTVRPANLLNTYEVLNSNTLLFMKEAIEKLRELWGRQTS